jgi:hypothetical protein
MANMPASISLSALHTQIGKSGKATRYGTQDQIVRLKTRL